ncbi:MAG: sulfatase-like hydrolase/transferase, partial [Chloroflexi bacterium]|nr:sulfatase-like hydrolase/transferase [Chloroflexota bacterium]
MNRRRYIIQGIGAGLVAGGLVGVAEVVGLVAQAGQADVLTALAYAVLAYGLLGTALGLVLGLLLALWRRSANGWSLVLGLVCAALLAPIAFYQARSALAGSAAVLASLLLAGGAWWLTRRPRGRWLARPGGSLAVYVALVLLSVVVGTVAGWSPASDVTVPPNLRDQPNVILIVGDALRADHLSCYAKAAPATPHIDALAGDGVLYRRMSAQASWTKPSVATIFTSLYPSSHQAVNADSRLPADAATLAEALHEQGYQTAGVVTNAYITPEFGFDQGFDSYVYLEPADPFLAPSAAARLAIHRALLWAYRKLDVGRWQRQTFGTWPGPYYQEAEAVNRTVLPWLAAHRGERFFLYVHYM